MVSVQSNFFRLKHFFSSLKMKHFVSFQAFMLKIFQLQHDTNVNAQKKILYARIANIPVQVSFFLSQSHLSFDSIQTYGCLLNRFRLFALDCLSCCEPLVFIRPVRAVPPRCLTRSAWRPENRWHYRRCPIASRFFLPGVAAYGPSSPGRCPFLWVPTAVCTVEQHSVPQVRCCSSS
jgi:hypothetical protein